MATTLGGTLIGLRVQTPELLPRTKAPFARTGRLVIAAVAVAPIAVYLYVALHRIGYPYELEWLEGGAVEIVNRVAHGHGIYVAPSLHYVAYPYPPLYFWVSALLAKGIGVGFVAPRLVSFVASLGSLVVLWDVVRRDTGDALAGLVTAGIFAATYVVGGAYFDLARVDSLFVFLLLASIAVARRVRSWRGGVAVGGLVFLSFFTKQTALLAAAPMFAYLLVARRRIAVSAIVTLAVLGIASTVVMNAVSHGWYDYFVFHELLNQGINAKAVRTFIPKSLIRPTGWAIGLALVGGLIGWRRACAGGLDVLGGRLDRTGGRVVGVPRPCRRVQRRAHARLRRHCPRCGHRHRHHPPARDEVSGSCGRRLGARPGRPGDPVEPPPAPRDPLPSKRGGRTPIHCARGVVAGAGDRG